MSSQSKILISLGLNQVFKATFLQAYFQALIKKASQLPPQSSARHTIYFQSSKPAWVVIDVDVLQSEYHCQKW